MSKSANGEGYCRRIDTNKYECTIMSRYINPKTGKEKRIKRVGTSESDARKNAKNALRAWEKEFEKSRGDLKVNKSKTFGEYMKDYLKSLEGTITDSCYRSYCQCMKNYFFTHPISRLQLHMLSEIEFQNFYDDIASHYSRKTCKTPMQLCRRCCRDLIKRSLLSENYAEQANLKLERADEYIKNLENKPKKEIFTEEDIAKLYEAFKQHRGQYAVVAIFLLETGLRSSEFAALTIDDIDFAQRIITIDKTRGIRYTNSDDMTGNESYVKVTKNNKVRIIPISNVCMDCIQEMMEQTNILCKNNPGRLLYPTFRNGKMRSNSTMEVGFKSLCNSLGIDRDVQRQNNGTVKGLCLHSLRHTANSFMKQQAASTSTIAAILGHSEDVNERIYTHSNVDMIKDIKTTSQIIGLDKQEDSRTHLVELSEEDYRLFMKMKEFLKNQDDFS